MHSTGPLRACSIASLSLCLPAQISIPSLKLSLPSESTIPSIDDSRPVPPNTTPSSPYDFKLHKFSRTFPFPSYSGCRNQSCPFTMRRARLGMRPVSTVLRFGHRYVYPRCRAHQGRCQVSLSQSLTSTPGSSNGRPQTRLLSAEGFSPDRKAFTSMFTIRGCEVGPDRQASIVSIANLLQENGANHAVAMWGLTDEGFALDPCMIERGLIWVMTRLQIQMLQYPKWGDAIEIETWLSPQGRAAASREHIITASDTGIAIGNASSVWVSINTKTRRIARIPDDVKEKSMPFVAENRPSAIPSEAARLKIEDIEQDRVVTGPVRFAGHMNLDMNDHINNVAYLTWALDLLPDEVFASFKLKQARKCDLRIFKG